MDPSSSSNGERLAEAIADGVAEEILEVNLFKNAMKGKVEVLDDKSKLSHDFFRKFVGENNILHIAIRYQQTEFVTAFLERYFSINGELITEENSQKNTPLHVAAEVGNLDIVKLLCSYLEKSVEGGHEGDEKKKPWRAQNSEGNTAVHVAILYHNVDVANFLLEMDPGFVRMVNVSKEAPLHLAVTQRIDSIKRERLQEASCVACWHDVKGLTPLHKAASLDTPFNLVFAKMIICHCPQSTLVCDPSGKSILHLLIPKLFDRKIVEDLICLQEIRVLINHQDHHGNTPLHVAAECKNINMVKSLLNSSAKPHVKNSNGISAWSMVQQLNLFKEPLHRRIIMKEESSFAYKGNIKKLIESMRSIGIRFLDARDSEGSNLLHLFMSETAIHNCFESDGCKMFFDFIEEALFLFPKLVCQTDRSRNTPVHILVRNKEFRKSTSGDPSLLSKLLSICANAVTEIESRRITYNEAGNHDLPWVKQNVDGNTPLHEAIIANNKVLVFQLLSYSKESARLANIHEETPLHLLAQTGIEGMEGYTDVEIMNMVRANSGALGLLDSNGLTPISRALEAQNVHMVVTLLCNAQGFSDPDGQTLWHYFLESTSSNFSNDLLQDQDFRKMLEQKDKDGNTPLHLAVMEERYVGFVDIILETWKNELDRNQRLMESQRQNIQLLTNLLKIQDNEGLTPIIRALKANNLDLATKLCHATPEAAKVGDADGKTIWHLLPKHTSYKYEKVKDLFQTEALRDVLEQTDKKGNTSLHLAIKEKCFPFVEDLLETWEREGRSSVCNQWLMSLLRIPNNDGETAEDLLAEMPTISTKLEKTLLTDYRLMGIRSSWKIPRTQLQNYVNSMNVIAALQTTITFTAAFTVPGGLVQEKVPRGLIQERGTPILIRSRMFQVFMISDVIAMCLSMMVLICLLWMVATTSKRKSVMIQDFALTLLLSSFVATLLAFSMGVYATIYPVKPWIAITTLILCSLLMLFLHRYMLTKLLLLSKYCKGWFFKMFSQRADSSNTQKQRSDSAV